MNFNQIQRDGICKVTPAPAVGDVFVSFQTTLLSDKDLRMILNKNSYFLKNLSTENKVNFHLK